MTRLRCVHLADDFAMGGVTKALRIYDHPLLAACADSRVLPVRPGWAIAPRLDADVIMTHFPPSWRTLPFFASLRMRNPRARLVHVEHSYTGAWEALKVSARRRFRWMLRAAYALCHDVVAVSHGQAAWLAEAGSIPAAKLHVLHPWSGAQGLLDVPIASIRADRPLRLAAYGRFAEAKGFDVLIDAVKRLDPARFELVLGGAGEDEAALWQRAANCRNIRFAGLIGDVAGFLAAADVVVVPSRWEAFGQVAAEARMAGRPVVVADIDGLAEQAGDAGIAADCTDATRLAATLATLPARDLGAMAQAARASMRDAETSRLHAWRALFARQASCLRSLPRRAAAPISTSAGQNR
ncbi:hypothetical protein HMP09_2081 [Sphingomonas sp. HMP9]|uniref:glycosyltransferase n=1 Tax=Sphingomonas sp. HMP9 TaxID=1517554 RepID=UPI001596A139|nr:glycosyltransferase [Sphingomonas sp. HMP9]BCA62847.1 hypothetical protein HMP09_2081 [Sphingomonas sp. HMP9]